MLTAFLMGTLALTLGGIFLTGDNSSNYICGHSELNSIAGDSIRISKHIQLSEHQCNEHILMIAPTGSGKSRRFIMPNVVSLTNCSCVVTDPSGEINRTCKTNKKKYVLNPLSADTIGYDPLYCCKNDFEVRKITKVILSNGMSKGDKGKQQEWVDMATPLLTAYMLMNFHTKKYTFDTLIRNITTKPILPARPKDPKDTRPKIISILEEIMGSKVESAITELQMFLQVMGAPQTLSSIRIVLNTCLQMFLDNSLQPMFHNKPLDFSALRKNESILYIQIPERHAEYYTPLSATFITQLLDSLLDNIDGLQIYLMLDEFTNIGEIPDICKMLATTRKYRIAIIAAIQSITQLFRVYGETDGKELRELFKTMLVCAGLKDSAEYVSKLVGDSHNKTNNKPLMTEDEIRQMKEDDILIICNNKRPVIDKLNPIYI